MAREAISAESGSSIRRPIGAALQHGHWRSRRALASGVDAIERFLAEAQFDRAPWLAVGFATGIALWFALPSRWEWLALIAAGLAMAFGAGSGMRAEGRRPYLRMALIAIGATIAAGCAAVWAKSTLVGVPGIARPVVASLTGVVLSRDEQPAQERVRLILATREPGSGRAVAVRLNLPLAKDRPQLIEGATVRVRARLMPPAPPMLPGGYDFARTAWFAGLAATGAVLDEPEILARAEGAPLLAALQRRLSRHVHGQLSGSPGGIAAAFASGDRGGISDADEEAMRDAGLTHLLSISGVHVSAVIAATYVLALGLFALWPWLALRVRLPILAAGAAAASGVFYTLLTGAEVPTVRSCIGALLVLLALALGREPLSLRMLAVAAFAVLLLWPEAVVGPSFQMSFAAVIAIIALHGSGPVRRFLAPREESWVSRKLRLLVMLLATGVVIELTLTPIGLFHFHKSGVYGALANVIAIPLTTFVTMPLIAVALVLDSAGLGAPAWWLCGKSIDLLIGLAHWVADRPGAVTRLPAMGGWIYAVYLFGALWLALWQTRARLLGLVPIVLAVAALATLRTPDMLISGDGRHLGVVDPTSGQLAVLRESRSSYASDTLSELAGMRGEIVPLAQWPGARCTRDFCAVELERGGRTWHLLVGRSRDWVAERELAAACALADVVVADRRLPASCRPRWLKADRRLLDRTGGLAIDLAEGSARSVAETQGDHGWWRTPERHAFNPARTPPTAQ
jgi:competence protein ComEC